MESDMILLSHTLQLNTQDWGGIVAQLKLKQSGGKYKCIMAKLGSMSSMFYEQLLRMQILKAQKRQTT